MKPGGEFVLGSGRPQKNSAIQSRFDRSRFECPALKGRDFRRAAYVLLFVIPSRLSPVGNLRVLAPADYRFTDCATGSCKPASLASLAALSVASQVKSGSLRPKCP
jgi:hypothetical protein